jgi:hypothetical protein
MFGRRLAFLKPIPINSGGKIMFIILFSPANALESKLENDFSN